MAVKDFSQQLGLGVASITFGVALSIFIYAAVSGAVNSISTWLLYGTSFLLMMRFWWRYNELFVQFLPSHTFWQFLLDFGIAFFGIIAVLFVNSIQTWALFGIAAMVSSIIRCMLSWKETTKESIRMLRKTIVGAVLMAVVMGVVYLFAPLVDAVALAGALILIVLAFVVYSSRK